MILVVVSISNITTHLNFKLRLAQARGMNESEGSAWADAEEGDGGFWLVPIRFRRGEEGYFSSRVLRDPYSGRVTLQDVNPKYNFVLVDLGSDPQSVHVSIHVFFGPGGSVVVVGGGR